MGTVAQVTPARHCPKGQKPPPAATQPPSPPLPAQCTSPCCPPQGRRGFPLRPDRCLLSRCITWTCYLIGPLQAGPFVGALARHPRGHRAHSQPLGAQYPLDSSRCTWVLSTRDCPNQARQRRPNSASQASESIGRAPPPSDGSPVDVVWPTTNPYQYLLSVDSCRWPLTSVRSIREYAVAACFFTGTMSSTPMKPP